MTTLKFKGYYLEDDISRITNASGVYIIYRCIYDESANEVSLIELLYIGKATHLNEEIKSAIERKQLKKECLVGETICCSFVEVKKNYLDIVENALIYAQQPRLNIELKDNFYHEMPVAFKLEGDCLGMEHLNFSIEKHKENTIIVDFYNP